MALNIDVNLNPRDQKVQAVLRQIKADAKGVDFGGGVRSLEKLSRPLGKITGQADEFEKSLNASNARVIAFGASVAVINKLNQAFGALVQNTVKVEATFAKINTILGGTNAEIAKFGTGIFEVAKKTGTAFDQVAEGALELARQGLSVEETLTRVEASLKLVRVAGVDSEQAVAGLTAAIKGFANAGITVAEVADKLAEVDTKFAVSTEDLINGLERASASARVAGVSLDELLAIITTVQERTQRGGAVIGNAFKTIFARVQRTDTLKLLQDLGIEVLDSSGNVRAAIPIFQDLAVVLNDLGLQSVAATEVIEKVAGVRQRDILINLIEDLTSGQSQFSAALGISETAVGSLDKKNAALNKTLEALINNVRVSAQELASVVGDLGFTDAAGDIIKGLSSVINGITDVLQGDSIGSKFAQGLIKGIGSVLTGPGLALVTAIFIKLFVDLAKFSVSALKNLLGINKAAQQQKALQDSILQTLMTNESVQRGLLKLEGDKIAQEKLLLSIFKEQQVALSRIQKMAATVSPGLYRRGFRGGEQGITGRGASGYIAEGNDVRRGVGGASPGSKVVSIPNFAFGGGKRGTMVANTSEYYVPNYAGGGDAIFNRDMVKSMGLPSGAKKINAAGGYIPNFAIETAPLSEVDRRLGSKKLENPKKPSLRKEKAQLILRKRQLERDKRSKKRLDIDASRFSYLVPQYNYKRDENIQGSFKFGKKGSIAYSLRNFRARGPIIPKSVSKAADPDDENIRKNIQQGVLDASYRYGDVLSKAVGGKGIKPGRLEEAFSRGGIRGAYGALQGAVGAAFEVATASALGIQQAQREKGTGDFDIRGAYSDLGILFGPEGLKNIGDFKVNDEQGNINSFAKKVATELGLLKNASGGYIPNFADPLKDAINREMDAGLPINQIRINQSGKLRNAQNPQGLAVTNTRDEPTGAIPSFRGARGFIPNFQQQEFGFMNELGNETKKTTKEVKKLGGRFKMSADKATGLIVGLSFLNGVVGDGSTALGQFINTVTNAGIALSTVALLKDPLRGINARLFKFGKTLGSQGGLAAKFGKGLSGTAKLLSRAGPYAAGAVAIGTAFVALNRAIDKSKDKFVKLDEVVGNIDLSKLESIGGQEQAQKELLAGIRQEILSQRELTKLQGLTGSDDTNVESLRRQNMQRLMVGSGDPAIVQSFYQLSKQNLDTLSAISRIIESSGIKNEEGIPLTILDFIKEATTVVGRLEKPEEGSSAATIARVTGIEYPMDITEFNIITLLDNLEDSLEGGIDVIEENKDAPKIAAAKFFADFEKAITDLRVSRIEARGEAERAAGQTEFTSRLGLVGGSELGKSAGEREIQFQKDLAELEIKRNDIKSETEVKVLGQIKSLEGVDKIEKETLDKINTKLSLLTTEGQTQEQIKQTINEIASLAGISEVNAAEFAKNLRGVVGEAEVANAEIGETKLSLEQAKNNAVLLAEELAKISLPGLQKELDVLKSQLGTLSTTDLDTGETRNIGALEARQLQGAQKIQEKIDKFKKTAENENLSESEKNQNNLNLKIAQNELKLFNANENAKRAAITKTREVSLQSSAGDVTRNTEILKIQRELTLDILSTEQRLVKQFQIKEKESQKEISSLQDQIDIKNASLTLDEEGIVIKNESNQLIIDEITRLQDQKTIVSDRLESEKLVNEELKKRTGIKGGAIINEQQLQQVKEDFVKNIPENFSQNLSSAFQEASRGAKNLGDSLEDAARNFGQTMLDQFFEIQARKLSAQIFGDSSGGGLFGGFLEALKPKASGGLVTGGSGVRDDVATKLMGGEYVVKKAAVDKYGVDFLERLNSGAMSTFNQGGIFMPGTRGQGEIVGNEDLMRFVNQGVTSGITDVISSGFGSISTNLEDQSAKLTAFGRRRQSPARDALTRARQQAFETVIAQQQEDVRAQEDYDRQVEARKNAVKGAFFSSLTSSVVGGALSGELFGESFKVFGTDIGSEAGGLGGLFDRKIGTPLGEKIRGGLDKLGIFQKAPSAVSNIVVPDFSMPSFGMGQSSNSDGSFSFAAGGSIGGTTNALVQGGEYIMSAGAVSNLGIEMLDDINNLRFANGGVVPGGGSSSSSSNTVNNSSMGDVNLTVNVDSKGNATVEGGGDSEQTPAEARKFAEKVKNVVLTVIAEEQRIAGSLFGT